jgi:hypothetical protein
MTNDLYMKHDYVPLHASAITAPRTAVPCVSLQTATEHYMAERLVVDDIVHWAKHYKVS